MFRNNCGFGYKKYKGVVPKEKLFYPHIQAGTESDLF